MHRLILLAALSLAVVLPVATGPALADERGAEVKAVMEDYLRLWNAHDAAESIASMRRTRWAAWLGFPLSSRG